MMGIDEDALICDLAETYHIYAYRSLPLQTVATFSVGLRGNSRIKMALANIKYPFETILLAAVFDELNLRNWIMSNDAEKPQSLVNKLLGKEEVGSEGQYMLFDTAEAFEAMWNKN